MNQVEIVIENMLEQIKQLSKENAVLKANLTIALDELEEIKKEEQDG